jgi:uncharacterized protein (TIGR02678 family)
MSGGLALTLQVTAEAERRAALRRLLVEPLVLSSREPEVFAAIVRHRRWLVQWFADHPGWRLHVDRAGGFVRLHKIPARRCVCLGARVAGKPPFNVRRYVLMCLTLAALDDAALQTTLARVAEMVGELSRQDPRLEPFAPTRYSERRAFVDVLRYLIQIGVLQVREDETEHYVQSGRGDALYDVDERILGQLLSAPVPPSLAGAPDALTREVRSETSEGNKQHAKNEVFRRLLDGAVVYHEELEPADYAWFDHSRGFVYRVLEEDVGFEVERRREGVAAVDPQGEVSGVLFPHGGSTVKHSALLLAERLLAERKQYVSKTAASSVFAVSRAKLVSWVAGLMQTHGRKCRWSKQYMEDGAGAEKLTEAVVELLCDFGLLRVTAQGVVVQPAIARFGCHTPKPQTRAADPDRGPETADPDRRGSG